VTQTSLLLSGLPKARHLFLTVTQCFGVFRKTLNRIAIVIYRGHHVIHPTFRVRKKLQNFSPKTLKLTTPRPAERIIKFSENLHLFDCIASPFHELLKDRDPLAFQFLNRREKITAITLGKFRIEHLIHPSGTPKAKPTKNIRMMTFIP